MLKLHFKIEKLQEKLKNLQQRYNTQRKLLIILLIINIVFLIVVPIYFSIQKVKYSKMSVELAQVNQTLDTLQHIDEPERGIELLKPIADYSIEDQKKYKLPPLPKSIKI